MAGAGDDETVLRFPILIGDIGGTNARFSVVLDAHSEAGEPQIVQTADFATIDDAIRAAVLDRSSVQPNSAVLAVAGPVDGDEIPLTNCPWVVKPNGMLEGLGLGDVVVLNDFEAQALAVVALGEEHMERIGGGTPEPIRGACARPRHGARRRRADPRVRPLDPRARRGRAHGHRAPHAARYEVFPHIETIEGRVSGADPVRARLVNTYRAWGRCRRQGRPPDQAGRVTAAALAKGDPVAEEALSMFITCLGRTAGDLALVFMSRGGCPHRRHRAEIVPALKAGNFRAAFEGQGPAQRMLRACRSMSSPIRSRRLPGWTPLPRALAVRVSTKAAAGRRRPAP